MKKKVLIRRMRGYGLLLQTRALAVKLKATGTLQRAARQASIVELNATLQVMSARYKGGYWLASPPLLYIAKMKREGPRKSEALTGKLNALTLPHPDDAQTKRARDLLRFKHTAVWITVTCKMIMPQR